MKLIDPHLRGPRGKRNYAADEPMHPLQVQHYRKMTVAEKLDDLAAMYRLARSLAATGIRMRHPDWDDEAVEEQVRKQMLYGAA
jgi:hypothetical protein